MQSILRKICFFIFLVFVIPSWGEENDTESSEEKSGYRYIIDNYFSKKRSSEAYSYSRSFTLYGGFSFYRKSTKKSFDPFSSFSLSFDQKIKEISYFGDIGLRLSIFSTKLERQRAVLLEITPRISVPEIQTAFPLYIGLGAGLGFYPHYIVRKIPSLSVSGQVFTGLRLVELYHNLGFSGELNLRIHSPFNELKIYLEIFGQFGLVFSF